MKPFPSSRLAAMALLLSAWCPLRAQEFAATNQVVVLTNAAQVLALSGAEAARRLPVHLCGLVMLRQWGSLTLMDKTAGIYLETVTGFFPQFARGDLIEVDGYSDPGKFAPYVKVVQSKKIGVGLIPKPQRVTYDDLIMGQFGAQWVEVRGVVRRTEPIPNNANYSELWLATGGGKLKVKLAREQAETARVDSEVQLRGLCFYQFNLMRQALNPVLTVPPGEPVVVLRAAPVDPYSEPVRSISSLMQFSPGHYHRQRVHVQGCVTHAIDGQFWIRDAKRGLRISTRQADLLKPGIVVDVLGFITYGGYTPLLEDAVFRKTGRVSSPVPISLPDATAALRHDSDLVELDATIQSKWLALDGCRLTLEDGTNSFSALLPLSNSRAAPHDWLPESQVRITGICSVNATLPGYASGTLEPQTFELLLRSPADLQILEPPPWWTTQHIIWVLGATVGGLLLLVAAGFWNHHRRMREQALARMKSEAEFSAVWNERNRMARELHDTLAQGLGAISVQLEVVKRKLPADTDARQPLEEARALARANLADARNSIWNMRSQVLETGDLAKALGDILQSMTEGTETHGVLRVQGSPRRLAPLTENNLLRIGQEAITNAVRHARAKHIEVVLHFAGQELRLSVLDDGHGFDPQRPARSEGGFGLIGMRERAAEMHAAITFSSEPGEGTAITLIMPFPN